MQTDINEVEINGVKYIRQDIARKPAEVDRTAVIVRSESAGVFFGSLVSHDPSSGTANLSNARRLWHWSGAASLSQLAMEGTAKPKDCKFPVAVTAITIAKVIEVIPCTPKACKSINEVAVWKV